MDHQANQTDDNGGLGFSFQQTPQNFPTPTKQKLAGIKFKGTRTDLEVYHLAYGTKKLKACTYRRMMKRQARINIKKAELLLVKSPEQRMAKAEKESWLRQVEEVVNNQKLKVITPKAILLKKTKGARKKKQKFIKKIKKRINLAQKSQTQMKDCAI